MDDAQHYDRRTLLKGSLAAAGSAALAAGLPATAAAGRPGRGPQTARTRHRASGLRGRGIGYDTGFVYNTHPLTTHEPFDPQIVKHEMRVIRHALNCNAVRLWGGLQERLDIASTYAAQAGLEVWYGPFTTDLGPEEMLDFLAGAARHCERLRRRGNRVVLVLGAELSLFQKGFLPGETWQERVAFLTTPTNPDRLPTLQALPAKMNAFFAQAVPLVRERFGGPISYASLSYETIDWTPFDYVGADFYPNLIDGEYVGAASAVAALQSHGKPVVITEMGCPAYDGAAKIAGHASDAIAVFDEETGRVVGIRGDPVRDEAEQADYVTGLLRLLDAEGVDSAFPYSFASRQFPGEFDIASHGVVRILADGQTGETYPKMPWEPKQAFHDIADLYGKVCGRSGR